MLRLMRMCIWNSMPVWISYRSFWQKWNFISGDKISCKHYPKWNAYYTCPSKYRVVLKCSWNETSCEQNLFTRLFEISNRYEFISPLMWTYSKILWANFFKFFNYLIAFTIIHIHTVSHYLPLMSFLVKSSKTSSFCWIFSCGNSSSTKTTDSSSFLVKRPWFSHCS